MLDPASPIFYCQSSNLNYNEYHFKNHSASMPLVNLKAVTHSSSKRIKNSRIKLQKRSWHRAVFSNLQRCGLETAFCQHKYITKPDRKKLADRLGLKDEQVSLHNCSLPMHKVGKGTRKTNKTVTAVCNIIKHAPPETEI